MLKINIIKRDRLIKFIPKISIVVTNNQNIYKSLKFYCCSEFKIRKNLLYYVSFLINKWDGNIFIILEFLTFINLT